MYYAWMLGLYMANYVDPSVTKSITALLMQTDLGDERVYEIMMTSTSF